jgi:hypothetical protein
MNKDTQRVAPGYLFRNFFTRRSIRTITIRVRRNLGRLKNGDSAKTGIENARYGRTNIKKEMRSGFKDA